MKKKSSEFNDKESKFEYLKLVKAYKSFQSIIKEKKILVPTFTNIFKKHVREKKLLQQIYLQNEDLIYMNIFLESLKLEIYSHLSKIRFFQCSNLKNGLTSMMDCFKLNFKKITHLQLIHCQIDSKMICFFISQLRKSFYKWTIQNLNFDDNEIQNKGLIEICDYLVEIKAYSITKLRILGFNLIIKNIYKFMKMNNPEEGKIKNIKKNKKKTKKKKKKKGNIEPELPIVYYEKNSSSLENLNLADNCIDLHLNGENAIYFQKTILQFCRILLASKLNQVDIIGNSIGYVASKNIIFSLIKRKMSNF
ncbi:hypothetical protein A3Q56_06500 [Intoshia linei]|uniref:Uncharacterized protein n=1 Tax=Intoshia linei TaxID=1819745 RepID=A0A177AUU0_9BILA|nr:hypothetical protein A3Q56_06500 [Intoshia linei]